MQERCVVLGEKAKTDLSPAFEMTGEYVFGAVNRVEAIAAIAILIDEDWKREGIRMWRIPIAAIAIYILLYFL